MAKGKKAKLVGADTGFFFCLKKKNKRALKIFEDCDIVISILTVLELRRQALKGAEPTWRQAQAFLEKAATIVDVDKAVAEEAANIAHSTAIPAVDSLILATLVLAGCKKIYTTDPHFKAYEKKGIKIINLKG
jgi:predicted nucleic acid-binding protein